MKEFVTANGRIFECTDVTTGTDSITLKMQNQDADDLEAFFRDVSELTTSFEKPLEPGEEREELILSDPHGFYYHLRLEYVTKGIMDDSVIIVMHIKSEIERRLDALEEGQEIQNGAIEELAEIVGGE